MFKIFFYIVNVVLTGTYKLKKKDLQREGYDITKVKIGSISFLIINFIKFSLSHVIHIVGRSNLLPRSDGHVRETDG